LPTIPDLRHARAFGGSNLPKAEFGLTSCSPETCNASLRTAVGADSNAHPASSCAGVNAHATADLEKALHRNGRFSALLTRHAGRRLCWLNLRVARSVQNLEHSTPAPHFLEKPVRKVTSVALDLSECGVRTVRCGFLLSSRRVFVETKQDAQFVSRSPSSSGQRRQQYKGCHNLAFPDAKKS
jgi:hypothetical protein